MKKFRVTIIAHTRSEFTEDIEARDQAHAEEIADDIDTWGGFKKDVDYWREDSPEVVLLTVNKST
jgi:hypothetical protein